jgi:hypothetical protein
MALGLGEPRDEQRIGAGDLGTHEHMFARVSDAYLSIHNDS